MIVVALLAGLMLLGSAEAGFQISRDVPEADNIVEAIVK